MLYKQHASSNLNEMYAQFELFSNYNFILIIFLELHHRITVYL